MSAGVGSQYYSAFNPLDIGGCALWLDATDQSTLTLSGSTVTQWNDKSGNGRNMTASGTITNTGSINGLTAANWESDAYFYGSASNTGTTVTVFAVFNMTSSTSPVAARVVSLGVSGTADYNNVSYAAPILRRGGTIVGAYRNGTELSRNTNATDQAVLMCSLFNGSTNTIYTNGTASSSVASTGNFNYTQHRIGSSTEFDSGSYFRGTVGEVIIYNDALSDTNRQIVEGYLSRKWFRVGFTNILVPIGPFVPTSISSCQLWLDAADTSSLTLSGSNVTAWNDKSGTSRTVTFSGTSTYNSTNKTVSTSSSSFFYANVDSRKTTVPNLNVFIVYKWQGSTLGTSQTLWGNDVGGGWNRVQILSFPVVPTNAYGLAYTGVSPNTVAVSGLNNSNQLLYNATYSFGVASATGVYINGIAASSFVTEAAASGQTSTTNTYFGTLNGSTYIAPIDFYELIIFNSSLTTTQRRQVEGYLTMKWGIQSSITGVSSTHPYYSIPPITRQFAPVDIPSCALWLDGADPNSMTLSGSNVTQWNDKSGNGRNTSSLTGTATLLTNSVNAKQGVYFNGTSYFTGPFSYSSNTLSWFVVGTVESDGEAYGRLLSFGTSGQYDYDSAFRLNALSREGSTNEIIAYRNAFIARNAFVTYGTPFVYSSVIDGTSNYPYFNGSLTTGGATSGNFGFSSYGISSSIGLNVQRNKGYIFEVLTYSNALSTTQRQQIEGYLAKKWGLVGSTTTIVPFSPTQISGCSLWLDSADSATIDLSGTMVTQWRDKSGNGRNTSAVVGTPQISLAGGFGSLPAIYFGATTAFTGPISYTGTTLTAFVVARVNTAANPLRFFTLGQSGRNDYGFTSDIAVLTTGNATTELGWYRNFGGVGTGSANVTTIYNSPFLYSLNVNGSTGVIVLNGGTTSSGTTSGSFGYTTYAIGAGFVPNLGAYLTNGFIAEILLYNASLTTTQRQQVEGYLANKWGLSSSLPSSHPYVRIGLPSTHPYISRNPRVAVFNPRQISGCQLWLDAMDPTTLTLSGSNVTQWNDKSGNGRNAVVVSTSNATWSSNTNGLFFSNSLYTTGLTADPTNETMFLVFNYTATTVNSNNIILSSPNANGRSVGMNEYSGPLYVGVAKDSITWGPLTAVTRNSIYLATIQFISGSSSSISTNGGTATTGSAFSFTSGSNTRLGAASSGLLPYIGYIYELISYNTVLSSSERQQVEGYLAWKWGLSGGYIPQLSLISSFTPTSIPGCVFWLDGDDTSRMTLSGTSITAISDKSASSNALTVSATRPTYTANYRNGRGAITMAGTSFISNSTFSFGLSKRSVFIVVEQTSSAGNNSFQGILSMGGSATIEDFNNSNSIAYTGRGSNSFQNMSFSIVANLDYIQNYGINTAPAPFAIYTDVFSPSSGTLFINGSSNSTDTTASNVGTSVGFTIGGRTSLSSSPTGLLNGYIYEIILYNNALSTAQRQQIEGYLSWKWGVSVSNVVTGLPSTHPYKLIKP